jgi:uncharacterized protein DUF6491
MKPILLGLGAAAALGACAPGPTQRQEADRRALAEARVVGEPVDCIDIVRIDHSRVRDDRTVDFYMRGREVYRNRLPDECPGLAFEDGFAYRTSLPRLCWVDTITVRSGSGIGGPACALGKFQRIETSVR